MARWRKYSEKVQRRQRRQSPPGSVQCRECCARKRSGSDGMEKSGFALPAH
ncbi:hypothetical protein ARMA_0471 [Ardenticatena maritima]|uniref:Uncharacterized protein n=1 Tax=Ardenticatena maritima TaxID=872965 RepID=A0A0M9UBN1_9CHLR|nr:hypothetical protein ARMA_0471 [Ardenticatena maritima]